MEMRDIDFMWNGGETRRYHGFRMLMEDTVGHHSFNVVCIILKVRPSASATLLRAAIKHDISEHKVGDMPAPSKRAMPDYEDMCPVKSFREVFGDYERATAAAADVDLEDEALTLEEKWVLKFADALDGMRFCINEMLLGNRTPRLIRCYETFRGYVATLLWGARPPVGYLNCRTTSAAAPATLADKNLYMKMTGRAYDILSK